MEGMLRKRVNRISDDALESKTGKLWDEWFRVLDKAGGRMMDHREIVAYLMKSFSLTRWWSQTLAVGYEQERGMRARHQKGTRFEVDRNKTIAVPVDAIWKAWHDQAALAQWLPGASFIVKRENPYKSLRLTWSDGSSVGVWFTGRGGKSRVAVSHGRLGETADVERLRNYWGDALDRLKNLLEA